MRFAIQSGIGITRWVMVLCTRTFSWVRSWQQNLAWAHQDLEPLHKVLNGAAFMHDIKWFFVENFLRNPVCAQVHIHLVLAVLWVFIL